MFSAFFAKILFVNISASIITHNEERNILKALRSCDFADEIVVVDSESTDSTRNIARDFGAKVYSQKWLGFGRQKQIAVDKCTHDWIFSLDADERVSDGLRNEILEIKNADEPPSADGYRFSRLSYYMGRPIRHTGWYPDWQLRLFDRTKGRWKDLMVHESVKMDDDARVKKIGQDILHYSVKNAAQHHKMIGERYAPLKAKQMFESGKRTTAFRVMTAGKIAFIKSFFLRGGFLDGLPGFCISRFSAHNAFLKHLLLLEMQNEDEKGPE